MQQKLIDDSAVCLQCRRDLTLKDWTCPFCGQIVAAYLFSTVTRKSLDEYGRDAYRQGFDDCMRQVSAGGPYRIQPGSYRPKKGRETAYRAGWQAAADKVSAKADRKFGRRRGVKVLGSGMGLLGLTALIAWGSDALTFRNHMVVLETPLGLGALNTVIGIVMILTGSNDEARPDA